MIAVAEAQARLMALAGPVAVETVPLAQAAGRWTADAVTALRTQPSHDLSAMDGYAIRFDDLPGPFTLIGESAAGHPFTGHVGMGEAARIFTGAAMPAGADTVMVQEDVAASGTLITLTGDGPPSRGRHIRPRGLDFASGETLIAGGQRVTPARLALAGAAGHGTLPVRRPVRIALLATGDELVPPGTPADDAHLPEANGVMLAALIADMPVSIIDLGILPDRLDVTTDVLRQVDADILVTTGGASVGDHDLIRPALIAAGGSIDFWRIALRPGKPMLAGRLNGAVVLGLPGNPVSAFVTAQLFLRPLIAHMCGAADPQPATFTAILGEPLPANDHRQDYLRATNRDGRVHPAGRQDSSQLRILADAACLILRPPRATAAQPGDSVEILPLA